MYDTLRKQTRQGVINLIESADFKKQKHYDVRILAIESEHDISAEMERIGVFPEGIDIMKKKGIFHVILLKDLSSKQAVIVKQEALSKGGEAAVSAKVASLTGDITDVLLMGTTEQLLRISKGLMRQYFDLPEIGKKISQVLSAKEASGDKTLRLGRHSLILGAKTYVMGILNITPDSFSDGGEHETTDLAVEHAWSLVKQGADIIDIGGESTRPGSDPVPTEEEIRRVIPVIKRLGQDFPIPISVDTYKSEIAEAAIAAGAHMINDISSLSMDPRLGEVVAKAGVPIVLMHMKGRPKDMQKNPEYESVVSEVIKSLLTAADEAKNYGISNDNILIDPGIGFGKTRIHNLELLRKLKELKNLGYPVVLGTSRKAFIGKTLGLSTGDRIEGTAATVALAVASGIDIVRVHDVKYMARVARMADAIVRGGSIREG